MQLLKPIIRSMRIDDVSGVYEVERSSFEFPWTKPMLEEEVNNSNAHYMVIEVSGTIIGYGGFWKIIDEAHITNVAIHPDYRGKGYGKTIVSALIQHAKDFNIIAMSLEVRVSNEIATTLYKGFGFVSAGVRKNYYQDNNEDAYIMWLRM